MFEFLILAGLATAMTLTDKKKRPGHREIVVGGLGDNRKSSEFNQRQLNAGIRVEMEHTKSRRIAREIAKDHLTEHKNYYTELRSAEKRMEGPTPKSR
jgi:hypothetical protein